MKRLSKTVLCFFVTVAACCAQCVVIDDFTTGKYKVQFNPINATATNYSDPKMYQTGAMLGGEREAAFQVAGGPFGQMAELSVANSGNALAITNGTKEFFRLDLVYGPAANDPLHYHPTGCDRFRVSFDSSSQQGINFNVVVFQSGGPSYQEGMNVFPTTGRQGFCVDFPFDEFGTNAGPIPQSFASMGIDIIDFVLQAGTAAGANAFAITKAETVDSVTAATHPCAFIAANK
jgi:hypothetical protein